MIAIRNDDYTDKFEPNLRVTVTRRNGKRVTLDVMATNNDKGEVYTSQEEVDSHSPCSWLEYSTEGGWGVDGYPKSDRNNLETEDL